MKPTVVQLILNAPAFAKSIMLAASASAHKTLLSLTKSDVGLGNVDNTADSAKPVSTAQQTAIDAKIGGSVGSVTNRLVRSSGTGGSTVQSTGITVADTTNNVSGMGTLSCGSITTSGDITMANGAFVLGVDKRIIAGAAGTPLRFVYTSAADADITAAAITASGLLCAGVYTFATVPSASSNTGKFLRISNRAQKHAYSDGTHWRFFGDDAIIS